MDKIIYVNRDMYNLGDQGDIGAEELRALANVPDDYDLWRVADWGYREWLKAPMFHDEKVTGRQFLGGDRTMPVRFYTAPTIISGAAPVTPQVTSDPTWRRDLEIAMLGTTDGDFIDPNSEIPAGEMLRLASEFIEARFASCPSVEGEGPTPGGIPDLTEAEASAYWEALHPPVEGEGEATREELIAFLHPLNDALNTDLATPWADALRAGFSITRKETKQ